MDQTCQQRDPEAPSRLATVDGSFLADYEIARYEIQGPKQEELIAANSMLLHEVCFDALGGSGGDPEGEPAAALRRRGLDVLSLEGGITAWRAMGWPTTPLEPQAEDKS